jgi:hypothetical protein
VRILASGYTFSLAIIILKGFNHDNFWPFRRLHRMPPKQKPCVSSRADEHRCFRNYLRIEIRIYAAECCTFQACAAARTADTFLSHKLRKKEFIFVKSTSFYQAAGSIMCEFVGNAKLQHSGSKHIQCLASFAAGNCRHFLEALSTFQASRCNKFTRYNSHTFPLRSDLAWVLF